MAFKERIVTSRQGGSAKTTVRIQATTHNRLMFIVPNDLVAQCGGIGRQAKLLVGEGADDGSVAISFGETGGRPQFRPVPRGASMRATFCFQLPRPLPHATTECAHRIENGMLIIDMPFMDAAKTPVRLARKGAV